LFLVMILISRMNFMIIGLDLEVLWKKTFGSFFGHFWVVVYLSTPKFSSRGVRLSWKIGYYPIFAWEIRKKWLRNDLLTPRYQLLRFLLKSTFNFFQSNKKQKNFWFFTRDTTDTWIFFKTLDQNQTWKTK
jgi:hypothetical protein